MNLGHATYIAWLLGAALPVAIGQWVISPARQRAALRATVISTLGIGTYLSIADRTAIHEGIWTFSDELTLGVRILDVPLEEVLFFYLTSLLVAQSLALFTASSKIIPKTRDRDADAPA